MTRTAEHDLLPDLPTRSWDDVKIEQLEDRLKNAGVTLPASPDDAEMAAVSRQISARDPELLPLLLDAVVDPLPMDATSKLQASADRAAKAQRVKQAPGNMIKSTNHKGREKPDGRLLTYIAGAVFLGGALVYLFWPSGSGTTSTAAGTPPTTSTSPQTIAGQPPQPNTPSVTTPAGTSSATGAAGLPTPNDPTTVPMPPAVVTTAPVTPSGITSADAAQAAAPVVAADSLPSPTPTYTPAPAYTTPAPVTMPAPVTPSSRTAVAVAVPSAQPAARVPLVALQPPARVNEGVPRLLTISAPPTPARHVVSLAPAASGESAAAVRTRVVAAAAPTAVASHVSSQTAEVGSAPNTARSGVVQQASGTATPTAAPTRSIVQQSSTGETTSAAAAPVRGIVQQSTAAAPTTTPVRQGLVSLAAPQQTQDGTAPSAGLISRTADSAAPATAGGLHVQSSSDSVSSATRTAGGLVALSGTPQESAGTTAAQPAQVPPQQAATVLGAPVASAPTSPYPMGSMLKATINNGVLFATVEGTTTQGVLSGQDQQYVYATAEDGSVWRGTPRLLSSGRIGVTFDRALVKGVTLNTTADATDDSGLPGIKAESHTDTPKLAAQAFQALLSGAKSFAQTSLQGETSITANGTIVSSAAKPNFWVTLGGALAGSLSLPSPQITQVDVTSLAKGTPVVLVMRGEE